jgi:acetyl esterase
MGLRPDVAAFLAGPGRALRFPDPAPAAGSPEAGELLARLRAPRPVLRSAVRRPLWRVTQELVPGPGGPLPVRVYRPGPGEARPLLVHLHGGGWVAGDLELNDATCRALAALADCVVVSVDYRLAPEHPYPAALEDALAAIAWARVRAPSLGADPRRIAIGGSSAGGNLAAAAALRVRDADPAQPPLAAQLLLYPVLDAELESASMAAFGSGHLLDRDQLRFYWDCYVPDPAARADPYASPVHAATLAGLPPAVVVTAELDPLCDEGEQYAARLRAAGVAVELNRARGQIHGFAALFPTEPEVEALVGRVARQLASALAPLPATSPPGP